LYVTFTDFQTLENAPRKITINQTARRIVIKSNLRIRGGE
jgi:hypothetical protein